MTCIGISDVSDFPPLPILTGPTGSGKTTLAVELAAEYPIEVISADSRQIIRRLEIGTAKPSAEERQSVRFHLIDIIEPGVKYSVARFIDDATAAIRDIIAAKHIPLIVGGTGLYLKALIDGVVEIQEPDIVIREQLQQELLDSSAEQMWRQLQQIDPRAAERIHPNNTIRVLRALEIYRQTGTTKSQLISSGTYKQGEFDFVCFCLMPPRADLYERINRRVDAMMRQGLLDEVRALLAAGLEDNLRRAQVIGYDELLEYVDGHYTLEEAVAMIKQHSRRYAKRQMTWFRTQMDCRTYASSARLKPDLEQALRRWQPGEEKS